MWPSDSGDSIIYRFGLNPKIGRDFEALLYPRCQHEMRIAALIDEAEVIERILRHLRLWEVGVRVESAWKARVFSPHAFRRPIF